MAIVTVGIDPGKSGAAGLLVNGQYEDHIDWSDGPSVISHFQDWLMLYRVDLAVLEKVGSMPGQGVRSTFTFGQNYGWWQGILDASKCTWREVRPQEWQKGLVPKKKSKEDKPGLLVARRLFPNAPLSRKKDNGRADGLLMGNWAFRQLKGVIHG